MCDGDQTCSQVSDSSPFVFRTSVGGGWRLELAERSLSMFAMKSLSLTTGRRSQKCDQDDVLELDFLAASFCCVLLHA